MCKAIAIGLALFLVAGTARAQEKPLIVGDTIPAFTLSDQDGKPFSVRDSIGRKILVIYFYPKDESPVCTKEACAFRDKYAEFTNRGALVIGINSAGVESHLSFQQHHQLPFILLSDPENKVYKQFGIKGSFGLTGRETFVVDLSGKIVYTYNSMLSGAKHMEKALACIEKMQGAKTAGAP